MANDLLADRRTGKNTQHSMVALIRQSIFSRLAGYEDNNDAERLSDDPAMRYVVGGRACERSAASTSQMSRIDRLREREPMRERKSRSAWMKRVYLFRS